MRVFLNGILAFIGAASLTDIEYDSLAIGTAGYDSDTYDALKAILESRDGVSDQVTRLTAYFTAKGVVIGDAARAARSNILIGGEVF